MAIEQVFTWLAIFIWVGLGAIIVLAIWVMVERRREKTRIEYAQFAELLGKPCWMNESGDYSKFRIVAVSHKGSVAVRRWDDDSGKHAKWIHRNQINKGNLVYFNENDMS